LVLLVEPSVFVYILQKLSIVVSGIVAYKAEKSQNLAESINVGDNRPKANQNAFRHVEGQAVVGQMQRKLAGKIWYSKRLKR